MSGSKMKSVLEVAERVRFADLLQELGPDAPTLCAGWTARDLAAHMVVIEHPEAWVGAGSARKYQLANRLHDRVVARETAHSWREQVERVRRGPVVGPFTWRVVRERMYIREYLIHHEDLRRANGAGPRADVPELQEIGWQKATTVGRFGLRRAPLPTGVGIELARADTGERFTARAGDRLVAVHGEPIELLLFAFGRRAAAKVDVRGDHDAAETLLAGSWKV